MLKERNRESEEHVVKKVFGSLGKKAPANCVFAQGEVNVCKSCGAIVVL
jgi:hypothetical protein